MPAALLATPVNTRPTLRVNGQQNAIVDELLRGMIFREERGGLASLEVVLTDWLTRGGGQAGFAFGDGAVLKLGAEIRAYAGSTQRPQELFRGRVSALESSGQQDGPPLLTVLAEDRLHKARKTRRSRVFERMTPADLVRKLAGEHNLTPVIRGLDRPSCDWVQANQSDLAFLRALLERFDADLQIVGDELQAGPVSSWSRGQVELRLHDNLLSVDVIADLADQATEVRTAGRDPASGETVRGSASSGDLGPGTGRTAAALLRQAMDVDKPETVAWNETMTAAEADLLARSVFQHRARRFVRATGRAVGNAALRVGAQVRLKRLNPLFEGPYIVSAATHRFGHGSGYITEFSAESAYFGGSS
jgi:uncharacterized protein